MSSPAPSRLRSRTFISSRARSLARFGLLFPDFPAAVRALVEAHGEEARWDFFRHAVALCLSRRRIVAEHLARHVAAATGAHGPHGEDVALLIFGNLLADENALAPTASDPTPSWENPDGTHPPTYWPSPTGGALAALLALTGTGLVAEYAVAGGGTVWRDACGALDGFGHQRNRQNCPVPTVLPTLNATRATKPERLRLRPQRPAVCEPQQRPARRRAGLHRHLERRAADRA